MHRFDCSVCHRGNATYSQLIRLLTCDLSASISVLSASMCLQPSWVYRSLLSPCAGEHSKTAGRIEKDTTELRAAATLGESVGRTAHARFFFEVGVGAPCFVPREERARGIDWDRSVDHIRASSHNGCIKRPDYNALQTNHGAPLHCRQHIGRSYRPDICAQGPCVNLRSGRNPRNPPAAFEIVAV